jgi:hypothetical protein
VEDYKKPLTATFDVKGAIGSPTGKRLLVTGDVFVANMKPAFPHEKRESAVYFEYPYRLQDAVRVTFPKTFAVESIPTAETVPLEKFAVYQYKTESTSNTVTFRRDLVMADVLILPQEYGALRGFYTKMETKDQEPSVLKVVADGAASGGN